MMFLDKINLLNPLNPLNYKWAFVMPGLHILHNQVLDLKNRVHSQFPFQYFLSVN